MGYQSRNRGAIMLVLAVVIVLIVALGFVGWRMLTRSNDAVEQATASPTETTAEVILTQDDLEAAEKSLDELDFTDEDGTSAEQQASL